MRTLKRNLPPQSTSSVNLFLFPSLFCLDVLDDVDIEIAEGFHFKPTLSLCATKLCEKSLTEGEALESQLDVRGGTQFQTTAKT